MAASPSSSSITNDGYEYDVFLNFRGPDTRRDFTGNIWNALDNRGIRTFRDDLYINKGENIDKSLIEAIQKSKAAIVVLSPDYATSSFCLDELCHILEYITGKGRFVWPIFYEVDPSNVRWSEEGSYGEAMAKHEENNWYGDDELLKWKNALRQVADLSGTEYKWKTGHGYEYVFINDIVGEVSRVIRPFSLPIPNHLVGLDAKKQHVLSLLDVGSSDKVYMVGIHGIGGIGKTTLAKVVYNSIVDQFDGSCYLEDVRENAKKQGLEYLQNFLFEKIFGEGKIVVKSVNDGIKELEVRLRQKKVLLLLDDVDELDQLLNIVREPEWFGCGSRVIITTRDTQVLRSHGVEKKYEVNKLNPEDAYDFLRMKAMKNNIVSPSHEDVFNRALTYVSGHPLAIDIMGSYLFSKDEEEWNDILDQYEKAPKNEILLNLKVSYNALAQQEQEVFLDIACFFKGFKLEEVEKTLHAHYDDKRKNHINVLIQKSLIQISESNVLTLHDLIEDMGKEIVRLESPNHPGKRSRVWSRKNIVDVLEGNTGTSKIEIMMCSDFKGDIKVNWDGEAFKNMTELRTLVIKSFSESPKHLPNSLRVLEWWNYPSECFPVDFYPRQLTICKLNSFNCPQYPRWKDFFKKYFRNMRILQFHFCDSLTSIPDMSGLPNLEEFSCANCDHLISFDASIGLLGKLKILHVKSCFKVETIPSLKLPSLEQLNLQALSILTSLSPMLDGSLGNLKVLSINLCDSLTSIPDMSGLPNLEEFTCANCDDLISFDDSIGLLGKLKILHVRNCFKLQTIPSLKLPSLEQLNLQGLFILASLSPMLDGSLGNLKVLSIRYSVLLNIFPSVMLPSLEILDLSHCASLESFSPMISPSMAKLKILRLKDCENLTNIPDINVASLDEFNHSGCKRLKFTTSD